MRSAVPIGSGTRAVAVQKRGGVHWSLSFVGRSTPASFLPVPFLIVLRALHASLVAVLQDVGQDHPLCLLLSWAGAGRKVACPLLVSLSRNSPSDGSSRVESISSSFVSSACSMSSHCNCSMIGAICAIVGASKRQRRGMST